MPRWPAWIWAWIVATALFFILRAGGAIRSIPLCVFLSAVAWALFFSLDQLRAMGPAHPLLRLRQIVLVVVIVVIPSLIDPSTVEIDNLPRFVMIVVASVLLLGVWAVDAAWSGWRPRRLANGFQWLLMAIVVWFGVTTLTSVEPRQSLLGRYGSYEGLILIAALAILALALSESFKFETLPALFRVVVASTIPVVIYGLIQFYGYVLNKKGSPLDFISWHNAYHNVFSTFGNPNHLGGYLVTVLPIGVVTAVLAKKRLARVALWVWVAVVIVLLLQTAARGAWLAALAGGAILVVGMLVRLRAKARTVGLVAAGGVLVAVALVASGSHFIGAKTSALFKFGSGSSVGQRYGYWSAAFHLALHHPIVGTGPDTFAVTYARYQDATLAKTLGSAFFVNGAHNIFFSWLANQGIPGLILIVALFAMGIAWGARAWRSLRASATDFTDDPEPLAGDARRYVVVALVAGFFAYFVQASFDVEQVGTLLAMFLMLGFLGIVNRSLWPLPTLVSPTSAFRWVPSDPELPSAEQDSEYPILHEAKSGVYGRSATQARSDVRRLGTALVAGAVGLTAVGLTFWRADAMWRADHDAWIRSQASVTLATTLNPWEPSYFETLGTSAGTLYLQDTRARDALQVIQASAKYYAQEAALDGYNDVAQAQYGSTLDTEAALEHSNKTVLRQALAALLKAKQDDPYVAKVPALIKQVEQSLGSG
jgi:O-antigen ligase